MVVRAVTLRYFVGRHGLAARVAVRIGLHITLVIQAVERLFTRYMPEVEHHFVPKARIQQVQHCVLDPADVEVNAASVSVGRWAHPIPLNFFVDKRRGVGGVEISQLIPTRAGPLWHHVDFTPHFGALKFGAGDWVVDFHFHLHPVGAPRQRRNRVGGFVVGVKRLWFEVRKFGQLHGQQGIGHGDGHVILVVHDRKRFAPISLA